MKAKLKGTQLNNLLVYVDGNKVGRMDYDHKRLYLFEWYDWLDQIELIQALTVNDIDAGRDAEDAARYWNDVVITVEDL